ncbi:MAG: hypothetical protein H0W27_03715 [Actinobacteria bacterium]|nr:hypothetical protein [Actinomycetota bacterium]
MAQRPSMDLSKLSTADKILLGAGLLFVIDTFLPWQRVCVEGFGDFPGVCASASAWGGNGAFAGVLAAIFAIALIAWVGMHVAGAGVNLNVNMSPAMITAILAAGAVLFGLIKFLLVITNSPGFGAFLGIVLLVAIAYGGYMKWQESKLALPPAATQPPPGPPPVG